MCKLGGCRCIHGASVILELFQVVQNLLVLESLVPNQFHHPDGKEVALGKTYTSTLCADKTLICPGGLVRHQLVLQIVWKCMGYGKAIYAAS